MSEKFNPCDISKGKGLLLGDTNMTIPDDIVSKLPKEMITIEKGECGLTEQGIYVKRKDGKFDKII